MRSSASSTEIMLCSTFIRSEVIESHDAALSHRGVPFNRYPADMAGSSEASRREIEGVLTEIESEHRVTVLFACESGSRAWGFEGMDSDWGIRLVSRYHHTK